MMLQNIFCPQYFRKHIRCLVNNGSVWNHINDPLHMVLNSQRKCKSQRRYCFAPACGDRQGIKTAFPCLPCCCTGSQNRTAAQVQSSLWMAPFCSILIQPFQQLLHCPPLPARLGAIHEVFCIQIIRIDQAGIQHPGIKCLCKTISLHHFWLGRYSWQCNLIYPLVIGFNVLFQSPKHCRILRGIASTSSIRQAAMVSRNSKSQGDLTITGRNLRTSC